jgi:hypothetical protein
LEGLIRPIFGLLDQTSRQGRKVASH